MKRELLIFRHGKSDWATGAQSDFERPLAKRGRKAIKRIAAWAVEHDLVPDYVLSSPAERARRTAERFCRGAGVPAELIQLQPDLYLASLEAMLAHLEAIPGHYRRVMMVGHNPGMEEIVEYLGGGGTADTVKSVFMPTAALAHLDMPVDWRRLDCGCARLLSITVPREL